MATPISKVTLTIDNRDYVLGLKEATNQTKTFANDATTAFNRADAASNKLNLSASNLTGGLFRLRGTLATIGFGAFTASALQGADAISDLSDATSINIGKLLEFQKALQNSGGNASDLDKIITTFYGSIEQANQGSDKMQETFAKLGISLRDLKTLSESKLLDAAINGFERIKDPVQQSAIGMDLFGKSFRTVTPGKMAEELETLRGKFIEQERATIEAADAVQQFEGLILALKQAIVLAVEPILDYFGAYKDGAINVKTVSEVLKGFAVIVGTAFVASKVYEFTKAIWALFAATRALFVVQTASAAAAAGSFAGPAGMVVGALAGIAASVYAYKELNKMLGQPLELGGVDAGPTAENAAGRAREQERQMRINDLLEKNRKSTEGRRNREQQIGKELQSQLDAVNQLMDGYKRASQANMDRYTQEVDILGKTEYEVELLKGRAEIEKKYGDQAVQLEEKKKGAKGQTLALINQSIKDLDALRTSELDIFEITRGQILNYKLQQEEVKRITDEIDKQIERQTKLGDILRGINDQRVDLKFETGQIGRGNLEKQFANIQENARKAAMEAGRAFAAGFEDTGDGLTVEKSQELADGLAKIAEAYLGIAAAQQANLEASRTWEAGWKEAFANYSENAMNAADQAKSYFETFTKGFEDLVVSLVTNGKFSFKDFANSIIADFARIQARKILTGIMGGGGAGGGGIIDSLFKFGKGLFGMAAGGPTDMSPMIVGERGPELFIPKSAGRIVANNALGSGGTMQNMTTVNYNIQAVDASSFRTLLAKDPQFIFAVTEKGRRSQPQRSRV